MSLLDILESEAPLSRVEEILQNILGASNEVDPESRVEKLLQNLIEVAYEVDPDSRVELLLDNLLGGHNEIAPMSRVEMLIANALGESYDVVPQSRVEELLVLLAEQYAVEYKTVSGSIVSVSDAVDAPMQSLVVDIEPVQDLHGYENPWPAGGGKNKFHNTGTTQTINGVTFTVNSDGTVSCSGTATATTVFRVYMTYADLPQGESLILNGCPSDGSFGSTYGQALCDPFGATLGGTTDSGTGATYSVANLENLGQYQIVVRTGINANGLVFKPMIRLASVSDATFVPYSNICPISGWTGMEVYDDPKYGGEITWNQLARFEAVNIPSASKGITYSYTDGTSVKINGTATGLESRTGWFNLLETSGLPETRIKHTMFFATKLVSGTISGSLQFMFTGNTSTTKAVGTGFIVNSLARASSNQIRVGFNIAENTVCTNAIVTIICCDLTEMFGAGNEPSTVEEFRALFPKDYYPYNACEKTCVSAVNGDIHRHVSIEFPQEAGTVYGGTLDVVSGELVVDRTYIIFDGSEDELWYTYSNTGYCVPRINIGLSGNGICNIAPTVSSASSYGVMFSASNNYIYFFQTVSRWGVATIADLRAWLATNNVEVCYELATPQTYHLTPTEVRTLLGQNNVWADTGDVEVTYLAKKH